MGGDLSVIIDPEMCSRCLRSWIAGIIVMSILVTFHTCKQSWWRLAIAFLLCPILYHGLSRSRYLGEFWIRKEIQVWLLCSLYKILHLLDTQPSFKESFKTDIWRINWGVLVLDMVMVVSLNHFDIYGSWIKTRMTGDNLQQLQG